MTNQTESVVLQQVERAFAEASIYLTTKLEAELSFADIDGLDSVSRVRLMLSVEDVFGIEISPKENSGLRTIRDLVDLVVAKQRKST